MSDLTEFLLARIAEDEAVAREAAGALVLDPEADDWRDWYANEAGTSGDPIVAVGPSRALAECEAKRRIVQAWMGADVTAGGYPGTDAGVEMGLSLALDLLALPYSYHPDYREEWRP